MHLSERLRTYIQYEVPPDAIFNHDRWEFAWAKRVSFVQIRGAEAILSLVLSDGSQAELRILPWSPGVVRFRFGRPGHEWPESSEMLTGSPETMELSWTTESQLALQTPRLRLRVPLEPAGYELLDPEGRCVHRSHFIGPRQLHFPLYPLGFQTEHAEERVRVFAAFDLFPDEALYGLGEKFGPLNKRGQRVVSWASDTTNCSTDRAYKNVPLLLSTRGWGLFLNNSRRIEYELGSWSHTALAFAVEGKALEWFSFYGPTLKELLATYTALTGHAPVPPLWSFGLWMSRFGYRDRQELEEIASKLREHRIPTDVLHLDPYWLRKGHACDLEWDEEAFPEPEQMLKGLAKQGFKVCLWEQPYVPVGTAMFQEGDQNGFFVKNAAGETLVMPDFEEKDTAAVDFTNPEAVRWYQDKHRNLLQQGVAVFKTDMGEAIPREAVFFDGRTGAELHNLYPLLYNRAVWQTVAEKWDGRGLVWGRSGYAGSQRYPVQWGGDSYSTFNEMAATLRGGLSYALSGVPFWSQDIGGFQGPKPTPELYVRWAQWSLFNSHSRCHGIHPREPWEYGPEAERIFRQFVELRYRLLPYIWSAAHEASETGLPVMRPLVLEFQEDPTTWNLETQYLFGPWLLVAPVLEEGGYVRFYLPRGRWLDFWTGSLHVGNQWIERQEPLQRMPLFIREGALIPQAPLSQFVGEKPWVPIELTVFVFRTSTWVLRDQKGSPQTVKARVEESTLALDWEPLPEKVTITWRHVPEVKRFLLNGLEQDFALDRGDSGERLLRVQL